VGLHWEQQSENATNRSISNADINRVIKREKTLNSKGQNPQKGMNALIGLKCMKDKWQRPFFEARYLIKPSRFSEWHWLCGNNILKGDDEATSWKNVTKGDKRDKMVRSRTKSQNGKRRENIFREKIVPKVEKNRVRGRFWRQGDIDDTAVHVKGVLKIWQMREKQFVAGRRDKETVIRKVTISEQRKASVMKKNERRGFSDGETGRFRRWTGIGSVQ
jgi:hypothetical protein